MNSASNRRYYENRTSYPICNRSRLRNRIRARGNDTTIIDTWNSDVIYGIEQKRGSHPTTQVGCVLSNGEAMKTIAQQLNVTEFPFEIKDKVGNEIYYEDYDGYWNRNEYDLNGNLIYFENSLGEWKKWEFDSNGNKIYYENSNGFWEKYEYDSEGNVIYYEDYYGEIYDDRPKDDVITLNGIKYKRIDE